MSEQLLPKGPEHHLITEGHHEKQRQLEKQRHEEAQKAVHEHQKNQSEIAKHAQEQAISAQEITVGETESTAAARPQFANRELKALAYRRNLTRVRKALSTPEKLASKVIHQPVVDKISEIGAHTVARPSGLLGGGIVALAGSSTLLYVAKHYGFEYNYLAFFLLFIGGFFLGTLAELGLKLVRR